MSKTLSKINTFTIPDQYVKFCTDWHSGQSSMMYAISSTGNLTLGSIRPKHPDEDRMCTDEEWYLTLWECLDIEVHQARKTCTKFTDAARLVKFGLYVESVITQLKETVPMK